MGNPLPIVSIEGSSTAGEANFRPFFRPSRGLMCSPAKKCNGEAENANGGHFRMGRERFEWLSLALRARLCVLTPTRPSRASHAPRAHARRSQPGEARHPHLRRRPPPRGVLTLSRSKIFCLTAVQDCERLRTPPSRAREFDLLARRWYGRGEGRVNMARRRPNPNNPHAILVARLEEMGKITPRKRGRPRKGEVSTTAEVKIPQITTPEDCVGFDKIAETGLDSGENVIIVPE